ncbi:MAG: hypothetical protein II926_04015 [Bacteroidales bacterium]|nr:hypothetical protein [Bacteroidales bacterium]
MLGATCKNVKRLLILAYDFPPYVSVGGLRPYAWYRFLKEYGVYPVVVTRQWENKYGNELDYVAPSSSTKTIVEETEYGTIIRTSYKPNIANRLLLKYGNAKFSVLRKAVTAFYEFAQFLFFVGPKSGLYRGAKEYLMNNKVDAIIATGEPFILFRYASALSKKYNTPWIADYRDPWVQNKNRSRFMGKWNAYFERKYTQNASYIVTVGEFFRMQISKNVKKPFSIIPNGYNSEVIQSIADVVQKNDILRFAFVGTIYKWHPLESVLDCFSEFAGSDTSPAFELNFYGVNNMQELRALIDSKYANLLSHIHIYPRIANAQLLQLLAGHNVMLLFNYYAFEGTKLYDYIGLRRKILFCYSEDKEALQLKEKYYPLKDTESVNIHVQEDVILKTNSGVIVKNNQQLLLELSNLYSEFQSTGAIACDSIDIERYSRKSGAKSLAELIINL